MSATPPARYRLHTIGRLAVEGPEGEVRIADPVALLALTRIALAGRSVSGPELQAWFFPELDDASGAASLSAALRSIDVAVGTPLIERHGGQFTIVPGQLAIDVALDEHLTPLGSGERRQFLADVLAPSEAFDRWVAETRARIRRPADAPRSHLDRATSVAIAVGGFALLAAVYATGAVPPPGFSAGDGVVLAAVEAAAPDSGLAASLSAAALIGLEQSTRVTVRGAGLPTAAPVVRPVPAQEATAFATDAGLRFIVRLRLERDEAGYRVSGRVDDVASGRSIPLREAPAADSAATIGALDRVIQAARTVFGERRTERTARLVPLERATTTSLSALRQLAAGDASWADGDRAAAIGHWERAVAADSGFALAMVRLARAETDPARAAALVAAARRHGDRLTWNARHQAEATGLGPGTGPR